MDDPCQNGGAIPTVDALDTCADVGAHPVVRGFRATLSACRASVAGVEHLRSADIYTDPQFQLSAGYQFQNNNRHSALFVGRRDGVGARWCTESMGIAQSSQSAPIACLLRRRRNYRVATRRPATRLAGRRKYDFWRDPGVARPIRDLGSHRSAVLPRLHLYSDRGGDGL